MKMGRFRESIDSYAKALHLDPNFAPSYIGQGNDYIFLDRPEEARKCFAKLAFIARDDGERRRAIAWTAASNVHEGNHVGALAAMAKAMAIARAAEDCIALAGDLNFCGQILLDAGRLDEATATYREVVATMEGAAVGAEIKAATRRGDLLAQARVALARGAHQEAAALAERYRSAVQAEGGTTEAWSAQGLLGEVAIASGRFAQAAARLDRANQEDPLVWLLKAKARAGLGDHSGAVSACRRAADYNAIDLRFAFVRRRALWLMDQLGRGGPERPASRSLPPSGHRDHFGSTGDGMPWRSASMISLRS